MNDAASQQAAAWLGAHALVLYAAVSVLLIVATLVGWRVLQHTAPPRPQVPSAASSVPRPSESGQRKRADKRGRIGPVDQRRWRMPRAKSFVSVPAEAVTPLSKPAWLEAACTRLLLSACCTLKPVVGVAIFWPIG